MLSALLLTSLLILLVNSVRFVIKAVGEWPKPDASRTESGGGYCRQRSAPPPHQLGGLEERCKLAQANSASYPQRDGK